MNVRLEAFLLIILFIASGSVVQSQDPVFDRALDRLKEKKEMPALDIDLPASRRSAEGATPLIGESVTIGRRLEEEVIALDGIEVLALRLNGKSPNAAGALIGLEGEWQRIMVADGDLNALRIKVNNGRTGNRIYIPLDRSAEYVMVAFDNNAPNITLQKVYRYFEDPKTGRSVGFGAQLDCHVDVACEESLEYQDDQQGAMRIFLVMEEGIGFCTGALMNNTAEDRTPYILSAFHCQDGYTPIWDEWRFDFMLSTVQCGVEHTSPATFFVRGADMLAGNPDDDFMLLKLWEDLDPALPLVYMGWDRTPGNFPDTVALIHHPMGDYKKASFNYDQLQPNPHPIFWNNGRETAIGHHYKCQMDLGAFENGSSGGPYLDTKGRVIGQLHGGSAVCGDVVAYAGMLSRSWDGSSPEVRLKDWLDPLGTGQMQMNSRFTLPIATRVQAAGHVLMGDDRAVPGALVYVTGTNAVSESGADGSFQVDFLNNGFDASLSAFKDGNHRNGVNVLDLIATIKHIVGLQTFQDPVKAVAADVDGSGSVNVLDLILMKKMVIGLIDEFPGGSWGFYPAPSQISQPVPPDIIIRAAKRGDTDFSADPTQ